jgi:hypothetical protein
MSVDAAVNRKPSTECWVSLLDEYQSIVQFVDVTFNTR